MGEWARWITGAWKGAAAGRVEALSGIEELDTLIRRKRSGGLPRYTAENYHC